MGTQSKKNLLSFNDNALTTIRPNGTDYELRPLSREDIIAAFEKVVQHEIQPNLDGLLARIAMPAGKKSFLVFKHNKYITVPTETIAYFYVKHESTYIMCLDEQEYSVNYSLEHIQTLLPGKQFFRLNRQYLINFNAVKEAEHYFARKLLVNLIVPATDKLVISKEKLSSFLTWMEDR